MPRLLCAILAATLASGSPGLAQGGATDDPWAGLRFLLGTWVGVGHGTPGEGAGSFTFELELGGTTLVRRSHSTYPATVDRPAATHEDLMVIYAEAGALRALYVDNEHHVIHYDAAWTTTPPTVTLTSTVQPHAPRYRFIYRWVDRETVNGRFEVAPPDSPDAFRLYIEGDARRVR